MKNLFSPASGSLSVSLIAFLILPACGPEIHSSQSSTKSEIQKSLSNKQIEINDERPLALIYKGPGSCNADEGDAGTSGYGCSEASADVATAGGFRYRYVGPKELPENATAEQVATLFAGASVWVQPGGVVNTAFAAMTRKLRVEIVNFVKNGGGYVGYCAGAYMATNWLRIFPANSHRYRYASARRDVGYAFLDLNWNGQTRSVYFEGGPYFSNLSSSAEVTATFGGGRAAAARATYGSGRVYIAGPHPEAAAIWSEEDSIRDPDGSDHDLAIEMMNWTARR